MKIAAKARPGNCCSADDIEKNIIAMNAYCHLQLAGERPKISDANNKLWRE
jgi:hypothetical protein